MNPRTQAARVSRASQTHRDARAGDTRKIREGNRHAVIFVEGVSDQVALETLARRRARNLSAEGISILPIGGAHAIHRFVQEHRARDSGVRLAGLFDAQEERYVNRALEAAGLGSNLSHADLEGLGFYMCMADLEDELIRCLGPARVEAVITAQGELQAFRSLQRQPAQRLRTGHQQLRRFIGTKSGRKAQYAQALVAALDLDDVPRPLDRVLAYVSG
jgi:hypothetical protein